MSNSNNQNYAKKIENDCLVAHSSWVRLKDQCEWYDTKSMHCQKWYKRLKLMQIGLASLIPIFSFAPPQYAKWLTAASGGIIALIEGVQQLNQYAVLWVSYRATAEQLKHEKYLFLGEAGPYAGTSENERLVILAERVEGHVSVEHAKWFSEAAHASFGHKS
ncbi:DUF4231 domain-containing protein [Desulfovibrio sp.]|uniref:DUF4231 domain-containing protein n=1 Tax=Desulfovibrio sp. TaxID=885 RepID=UPI0025C64ECF|nr:DUF4231 domain-containing protein [Desulfovibrio sp.]